MRIVVVGASSGLGRCIGIGLAKRGAQTALLAVGHQRQFARLFTTVFQDPARDRVLLYITDLAQADARFITLRVGADNIPKRGDLVDIMIDPDRIHLFDAVTGAKISWRSGPIAAWSLRYAGDA